MVPWPAVLIGVLLSVLFALPGALVRSRSRLSLTLLLLAPLVGWAASIYKLQGVPRLPPLDIPQWAIWAGAGSGVSAIIGILAGKRWKTVPLLCLIVTAIGSAGGAFYLYQPYFPGGARLQTLATIFAPAIALLLQPLALRGGRFLSAGYAPWCTGLTAASMVLALTGTATVSLLALTLAFVLLPPAIAALVAPPHSASSASAAQLLLPAAAAFPFLVVAGPTLASTPANTALAVAAAPLLGMAGLAIYNTIMGRRGSRPGRWRGEVLAIIIALVLAAAPAAWAVVTTMQAAATEESLY